MLARWTEVSEPVDGKSHTKRSKTSSIDEYISGFAPDTREALSEVRQTIHSAAPEAVETISYAIPTFDVGGRHLVHFAGYARHVGFYPGGADAIQAFAAELEPYRRGKGSVRFPLDRPMPLDLIARMVAYRLHRLTQDSS